MINLWLCFNFSNTYIKTASFHVWHAPSVSLKDTFFGLFKIQFSIRMKSG
jgi:hypothetical protein